MKKTIGIIATVCFTLFAWTVVINTHPGNIQVKTDGALGTATLQSQVDIIDTLLNKPGGFVDNDILPPVSLFGLVKLSDNMSAFEVGAIKATRDFALIVRDDLTRAQSQSSDDPMIVKAHTSLQIDTTAFMFPAAEDKYEDSRNAYASYIKRLNDENDSDGNFYAKSIDLAKVMERYQKALGSYGQKLAAAQGKMAGSDLDLSNDPAADKAKSVKTHLVKTEYMLVDNIFYEAMGYTWAVSNTMKSLEHDFSSVLDKKNAKPTFNNIIESLDTTQHFVMYVSNGGFSDKLYSFAPNFSLSQNSYLSQANAGMIDLMLLLNNG